MKAGGADTENTGHHRRAILNRVPISKQVSQRTIGDDTGYRYVIRYDL